MAEVVASVSDIEPSRGLADEAAYFANMATRGEELVPLPKPCRDCAVEDGLYREISDALADQPEHIRTPAALRWWCHNNGKRACRGNIDNIARINTPTTKEEKAK